MDTDIKVALQSVDDLIGLIEDLLDSDRAMLIATAPAVQGLAKRSALMDAVHKLGQASRTDLATAAVDDVVAAVEHTDEYDEDSSDWVIACFRLVDAVVGLMARDLIDQDEYRALTGHVASVLGRLHPDDPEAEV